MSFFGIVLASLALVLVNLGVGWVLAKKHGRGQFGPAVRRLFQRDRGA